MHRQVQRIGKPPHAFRISPDRQCRAVFNLLPLPPLDGEQIAVGLLPDLLASPLARLEPYGAATYKRLALQEELLRGDRSALRQKTIEAVSRLSWRLVDFSWPARVA